MARFEFKQDPPETDILERAERRLNILVRYCGLTLMMLGMLVAVTVMVSAWSLYRSPTHIEHFAQAVEQGSHLDLTLSRATQSGQQQLDNSDRAGLVAPSRGADSAPGAPPASFRFSYFMAWLLAVLLLLLVGHLAIAAVRTGGQLALYDIEIKKYARAMKQAK